MAFFENGYKTAARTELERSVREVEEGKKEISDNNMYGVNVNIDFAQKLQLITNKQAQEYKARIQAAIKHRNFQRTESGEIVDDFENPRERTERYMRMDEVRAKIAEERAGKNSKDEQGEQQVSYSAPQKETEEKTK